METKDLLIYTKELEALLSEAIDTFLLGNLTTCILRDSLTSEEISSQLVENATKQLCWTQLVVKTLAGHGLLPLVERKASK